MTEARLARGIQLTPDLRQRLIAGAQSGLHKSIVATGCGIAPELLDGWLDTGLSPDAPEPYGSFARDYIAAENTVEHAVVQAVGASALRDWKAGLAFLAARYPKRWGVKAAGEDASDRRPRDGGQAEALAEELLQTPEMLAWLAARGFRKSEP